MVFVRLTIDNNSFWVLQLTRVFTFRIRDSLRVFSRRQASRNKRVGAVGVIDGVGRSQQEQQTTTNFRWSNSCSSSLEDWWCTTGKQAWQEVLSIEDSRPPFERNVRGSSER
jgi:hypothetical protein